MVKKYCGFAANIKIGWDYAVIPEVMFSKFKHNATVDFEYKNRQCGFYVSKRATIIPINEYESAAVAILRHKTIHCHFPNDDDLRYPCIVNCIIPLSLFNRFSMIKDYEEMSNYAATFAIICNTFSRFLISSLLQEASSKRTNVSMLLSIVHSFDSDIPDTVFSGLTFAVRSEPLIITFTTNEKIMMDKNNAEILRDLQTYLWKRFGEKHHWLFFPLKNTKTNKTLMIMETDMIIIENKGMVVQYENIV